ncbi:MAG: hypothetical protein HYR49_03040 [Gammaproteobacteria bacterium]|nr:hypothetical protein [Gammaproteobacteria bacterium]
MTAPGSPPSARRRFIPVLMVLVFAAPVIASWYLFHFTQVGRGTGGSHGRLVVPPRPLPAAALYDITGAQSDAALRQRWTLLFLVPESCEKRCLEMLLQMRQLRYALGRDAHRVQRALVVYGKFPPDLPERVRRDFPGQLLLAGSTLDGDDPGHSFVLGDSDNPLAADRLYLVDPLGNLMLAYPSGADPVGIIKDLRRLLRYSGAG